MRVLHVSEALGGGITSSILSMVEATPEVDHHLFARPRSEHDTGADLTSAFGSVHMMPSNPAKAVLALRRLERELFPDVVHAHSSFGGLLVRATPFDKSRIVYSPHCFAFERRDISRGQRRLFETVERVLAPRTDMVVAVAPNEIDLATLLGHKDVAYAPNRTTIDVPEIAQHATPMNIVAAGRICPQKDWRYFLHVKRYAEEQLGLRAAWTWLGGGDEEGERALVAAGVTVTGWIDREELISQMARAQVYLHTAAWEAAPISILEAASLGLPLAIRSISPLDSLALPGRAATAAELAGRLVELGNRSTWLAGQRESLRVAERHSRTAQGWHLRAAYDRVTGRANPGAALQTVAPQVPRAGADVAIARQKGPHRSETDTGVGVAR